MYFISSLRHCRRSLHTPTRICIWLTNSVSVLVALPPQHGRSIYLPQNVPLHRFLRCWCSKVQLLNDACDLRILEYGGRRFIRVGIGIIHRTASWLARSSLMYGLCPNSAKVISTCLESSRAKSSNKILRCSDSICQIHGDLCNISKIKHDDLPRAPFSVSSSSNDSHVLENHLAKVPLSPRKNLDAYNSLREGSLDGYTFISQRTLSNLRVRIILTM